MNDEREKNPTAENHENNELVQCFCFHSGSLFGIASTYANISIANNGMRDAIAGCCCYLFNCTGEYHISRLKHVPVPNEIRKYCAAQTMEK